MPPLCPAVLCRAKRHKCRALRRNHQRPPPMFRNRPKDISVLLQQFLRDNCLETPMLQQRLLNVWEEVAGDTVARYTEEKTIKNQKLIVKISNSALRADLQMKRTALKDALNKRVGAFIISDIILR